jgi:hypothetical protein
MCGDDWPCVHARLGLTIQFAEFRATLIVYLSGQYVAAMDDLWPATQENLYKRFVLWA